MRQQLIEIALAVCLAFGAYQYIGHRAVEAYKDEQKIVQLEADKKQAEAYNLVAQELEELKNKRQENAKTITKYVEKIVDRPVYLNECIDDDGLHILNSAIKGGSASEPNAAVQATK